MLSILITLSLLFIGIGYLVTENNAKYLLSGYNTMNDKERKKVDIKKYIPYFRKFHIFLGISLLTIGLLVTFLINKSAGGIFLSTYPIIAYVFFLISGSKYTNRSSGRGIKIGVAVLIGMLLFFAGLFGYGIKENQLTVDSIHIKIGGMYGEKISQSDIQRIELVNQLPEINLRTNGFALGAIKKGYFKTQSGELVKLIINSENKPLIFIEYANGKKIYYSAKRSPNEEIIKEIKKTLPNNG